MRGLPSELSLGNYEENIVPHANGVVNRANPSIFRQVYLHKSLMEQLQVDITTSSGPSPARWSSVALVKGHTCVLEYRHVTNVMHSHLHGTNFLGRKYLLKIGYRCGAICMVFGGGLRDVFFLNVDTS